MKVIQPLLHPEEMEALKRILDYLKHEEQDYAALPPEERSNHIYRSVLMLHASGLITPVAFPCGNLYITPGAALALEEAGQEPGLFLSRHFAGDWGDVNAEDWQENLFSLENGFRLLSSYHTEENQKLWVITEADRSSTTILLPDEY